MKCKAAKCRMEVEAVAKEDASIDVDAVCKDLEAKGLLIRQWDLEGKFKLLFMGISLDNGHRSIFSHPRLLLFQRPDRRI